MKPRAQAQSTIKSDDEEDDYSDSFEEVNATVETVQRNDIEDLLKTATED